MKQPQTIKPSYVSPRDWEIMETVIKASCQYYNITEEEMLTISNRQEPANIRRQAMYLISTNTALKPQAIADRFGVSRYPVTSAMDIIPSHKKIYIQTAYSLRDIVAIVNSFEKKHQWQINP